MIPKRYKIMTWHVIIKPEFILASEAKLTYTIIVKCPYSAYSVVKPLTAFSLSL